MNGLARRQVFFFCALAMIAARPWSVHAARIVLVRGGEAVATVVIPSDAPTVIRTAAEDLRHYVSAICGVDLPLRDDGSSVPGTGLYIGGCDAATAADLPGAELNPETYAIRVRDGSIFFTGRHPTPAAFAVFSFIEDTLGVRWFAPGELWEHVPPGTPGELAVDQDSLVKVPGTSPRIWSGHHWYPRWKTWNLRNKTVPGEVIPRRQFQNRVHQVFPTEKYGETHPEYYPLVDGKRFIPPSGMTHWRPCEGNPEVQRLVVEFARRWLDARPDTDSFSVGMDDISHLCSCPLCRAMDPRPDSYEKREFSDRHYTFVNAIARDLGRTHPDRYIGTLIYNIARDLPETVERLEPNVFGFITETSALWWQEGRKQADHELTREWAKRCSHMSRYDYYGMGCFTPRFYPHSVAEQITFDKSLGIEGMYIEVYTFLPHTAPMIWMTAKLQWEHAQDADELLNEFYSKMYGSASDVMTEYWDLLERSWNTPRPGRTNWVHRRIQVQALAMSPDDVDAAFVLLDKAIAACETEAQRKRIAIHRDALRYSSYAIYAYAISNELRAMRVTDAVSARAVIDRLVRLGDLAQERRAFYEDVPDRDDLLGLNVRALTIDKPYMPVGDFQRLEGGAFPALNQALDWYVNNNPTQAPVVADRLEHSLQGSVGDLVRSWLWVTRQKPEDLIRNGDFEATGTNRTDPEQADWSTEGAPPEWSVWSRTPGAAFATRGGIGVDASRAATIVGAQSAVYIQSIAVQPGERYLCTARVRCEGNAAGEARLAFRLRTPEGGWHKRRDLEGTATAHGGTTGWQTLALLIDVPEGTGSISIMPGAGAQTEDALAVFDDIRLYRIPPEVRVK